MTAVEAKLLPQPLPAGGAFLSASFYNSIKTIQDVRPCRFPASGPVR
jgi:hypothetical protein